MTIRLRKAFDEASRLSEDKQDMIAAAVHEEIHGDNAWDELLSDPRSDAFLSRMSESIEEQRKRGDITSGEEFLREGG